MKKILVWDWPVRIGHWLMAGGFAVAWLTSESETFRLVHVVSGAIVLAIAAFRLVWGFWGSRHARFTNFVHGPKVVGSYVTSLLKRQPEHHTGHNPAGGWAILLLLTLGLLSGISGWAAYNELGGDWLKDLHEGLASSMLAVVVVHLIGVISGSWMHRENLVRAMLTGIKQGNANEAIRSTRPLAAMVLLVWVALAGWILAS